MSDKIVDLWCELLSQSSQVDESVMWNCFIGGGAHDICGNVSEDKLKTLLGISNNLMNETSTRIKGITVFNKLMLQWKKSQIQPLQENLQSSLHLLAKSLDLPIASTALVNFIPLCRDVPELNSVMSSTVIPKIMSYFCNVGKSSHFTAGEVQLIDTCIQNYRGACGSYKTQLFEILRPIIDSKQEGLLRSVAKLFPSLSSAGGGGHNGVQYTAEWGSMVMKILHECYENVYALYSEILPTLVHQNNYGGQEADEHSRLVFPDINESDAYKAIVCRKIRVVNLLCILESYLSYSFPAPKNIPVTGVLDVLKFLFTINPVDALEKAKLSGRKENVLLACVIPQIQESAFKALCGLAVCVEDNLISHARDIQQIVIEQINWMQKTDHNSFVQVKSAFYNSLYTLFSIPCHIMWCEPLTNGLTNLLLRNITLEKPSVILHSPGGNKNKGHKKGKNKSIGSMQIQAIQESEKFLDKNSSLCGKALNVIDCLIPILTPATYRLVYTTLMETITQLPISSTLPVLYADCDNRKLIFSCVLNIAMNPRCRVNLPLIISLFTKGTQDTSSSVSHLCQYALYHLERLAHPICNGIMDSSCLAPLTEETTATTTPKNLPSNESLEEDVESDAPSSFDDVEEVAVVSKTQNESAGLSVAPISKADVSVESTLVSDNIAKNDVMIIERSEFESLKVKLDRLSSIIENAPQLMNNAVQFKTNGHDVAVIDVPNAVDNVPVAQRIENQDRNNGIIELETEIRKPTGISKKTFDFFDAPQHIMDELNEVKKKICAKRAKVDADLDNAKTVTPMVVDISEDDDCETAAKQPRLIDSNSSSVEEILDTFVDLGADSDTNSS